MVIISQIRDGATSRGKCWTARSGTYGFSDVSGQRIPRDRLDVMPEAINTLSEQEASERIGRIVANGPIRDRGRLVVGHFSRAWVGSGQMPRPQANSPGGATRLVARGPLHRSRRKSRQAPRSDRAATHSAPQGRRAAAGSPAPQHSVGCNFFAGRGSLSRLRLHPRPGRARSWPHRPYRGRSLGRSPDRRCSR
jgi:hypothetical protein